MVDAIGLKQPLPLLEGRNKFKVAVVRLQNHPGMRKKGQQHGLSLLLRSNFTKAPDDLLMTYVHTVEGADGDNGFL